MTKLRNRILPVLAFTLAIVSAEMGAAAEAANQPGAKAAEPAPHGELVAITEKDAAWVKQAKADYPLTDCVVSGEKLGSAPDEMFDFIYREKGKPDCLVSFCCEGCSKDFLFEPSRFIKKLDDASAAKK
jgi:hypothetical protein